MSGFPPWWLRARYRTLTGVSGDVDPPVPDVGVQALRAYDMWDNIGVNTHVMRNGTAYLDLPATINAIQQLGVRHHRTDASAASQNITGHIAAINQIFADAGAKAQVVMGKPAYTRPSLWPAASLTAFIAGGLNSDAVGAFEGPNEQNLAGHNELPANGYTEAQWATATMDHQTELFTTANSSTRPDAWRAIPVVGWSFANPNSTSVRLAECSTVADWDALCDISNMHKYVPTNLTSAFQPALGNVRTYIYNNLSHPLYVTETGYHTLMTYTGSHAPTPLDAAAWYTVKTPFVWMKNGLQRVFFYELLDEFPAADPIKLNQGHYGFFTYKAPATAGNFVLKPNGVALANLLAIYADASGASFAAGKLDYTITASAPSLDTMLHQRSTDNAFLLALYRDVILFNRTGAVSPFGTYPTVADVNVTIDLGRTFATVEHRRPSAVTGAGGGPTLISTATNVSEVTIPVGKHLSVLVIK